MVVNWHGPFSGRPKIFQIKVPFLFPFRFRRSKKKKKKFPQKYICMRIKSLGSKSFISFVGGSGVTLRPLGRGLKPVPTNPQQLQVSNYHESTGPCIGLRQSSLLPRLTNLFSLPDRALIQTNFIPVFQEIYLVICFASRPFISLASLPQVLLSSSLVSTLFCYSFLI